MAKLDIIPYEPHHLAALQLQPAQAWLYDTIIVPGYAESLAAPGLAWSGQVAGATVGCAGFLERWAGRATAWALLSPAIPRTAWIGLCRRMRFEMRGHLAAGTFRRIDCMVLDGFLAAHRLALALGMRCEGGRQDFYGADGRDYWPYAMTAARPAPEEV